MTVPVFLFDIDGTIADCTHRLHYIEKRPKNWEAFYAAAQSDIPIRHMRRLAMACAKTDGIIYITCRPERFKDLTERWIKNNNFPAALDIYMRAEGDGREDDVVKPDLLRQVIRDGFAPIMAFDDRSKVVKALRNAGLPVAQVADGDY